MRALIDLLEFLNDCSSMRASAYMFFMVVFTYLTISTLSRGITDIVFVLRGYKKTDKK